MGLVIFSGFLFLIGLVAGLGALFGIPKTTAVKDYYGKKTGETQKNYGRIWAFIAAPVIGLILPAAIIGLAGNHSVPTKSVGVITSFGKVVGKPYGPGSHWMAPWQTLNIVQDTIQSDNFNQANGSGADQYSNSHVIGDCITVRLGGQQQGCADVRLQTQVNENAVPALFANYSSYGANLTYDIDQYVVKADLTTVLNRVLGDYNPIEDVSQQLEACDLSHAQSCNTSASSQFSRFDPQLVSALQSALGNQVSVYDVNLQYIHYDPTTEAALQKIQTSYTDTAVAVQQEQTNTAVSVANAALAKNNTLTPQVLANECYTTTQDAVKANYTLPASWNCSGSPSNLLINGK